MESKGDFQEGRAGNLLFVSRPNAALAFPGNHDLVEVMSSRYNKFVVNDAQILQGNDGLRSKDGVHPVGSIGFYLMHLALFRASQKVKGLHPCSKKVTPNFCCKEFN